MSYLFEHADFDDLLNQAAQTLNLPLAFVEKDYWVTYVLYRLKKENIDDVIFKGGTSLTKGWNLLDRFSEDIDLLFVPSTLPKEKQKKRLKKIQEIVCSFKGLVFDKAESTSGGHFRTDCYSYKRKTKDLPGGILPYIKLEMGFRGGEAPADERTIQSYIGSVLEKAGAIALADDVGSFLFKILDQRRTFVEKIFAIHTAFERQKIKENFRHYYDVHILLSQAEIKAFVGTLEYNDLKAHVAAMTKEFFAGVSLPENLKFSTSGAFKDTSELIALLDEGLRINRSLFYKEPPAALEIIKSISQVVPLL
jgi:hypothetical protein